MGAIMKKDLTLKMGQQHAQKYTPRLLDYVASGQVDPAYLLTHPMPRQAHRGLQTVQGEKRPLPARRLYLLAHPENRLAGRAGCLLLLQLEPFA